MTNATSQTIIQQIQPQCAELYKKLKHEKDIQGKTNKSVAKCTGVSISTVSNLFAGSATSPSVFDVSAICIHLGLSLDELMGIEPPAKEPDDGASRIAELEAQLDRANSGLELVKHHSEYLEANIAERKPIIYGLTALCLLLAIALFTYLVMDIGAGDFGFFRDDRISLFGIVMIAVLVTSFGVLASYIIRGKIR